jgi:hypothetical protein
MFAHLTKNLLCFEVYLDCLSFMAVFLLLVASHAVQHGRYICPRLEHYLTPDRCGCPKPLANLHLLSIPFVLLCLLCPISSLEPSSNFARYFVDFEGIWTASELVPRHFFISSSTTTEKHSQISGD